MSNLNIIHRGGGTFSDGTTLPPPTSISNEVLFLKQKVSGNIISVDDVSPVEHSIECKISGVPDLKAVKVSRYGKNLLSKNSDKSFGQGVTFTKNSDGTVKALGTVTGRYCSYSLVRNSNEGFDLPAGTYVLSGCPAGGTSSKYYLQAYAEKAYSNGVGILDTGTQKEFSLPEKDRIKQLTIWIKPDAGKVDLLFKPMIRLKNSNAEYEPYKGQDYFPLEDGTVKDLTPALPNTTILTDTEGVVINAEYKKYIEGTKEIVKESQSGEVIAIDGISKDLYAMGCKLKSDTITDFSTVKLIMSKSDGSRREEYTPSADGVVDNAVPYSPDVKLSTDAENVIIDADYFADFSKHIAPTEYVAHHNEGDSLTATIGYKVNKLPLEQQEYLKDYVVVVNENRIPQNPFDGEQFIVGK